MRNEMDIWLKWLHRLTQCSRFFLARNQKYLCPMETGGSERMLLSQFTDELNLVAHPVGNATHRLDPCAGQDPCTQPHAVRCADDGLCLECALRSRPRLGSCLC